MTHRPDSTQGVEKGGAHCRTVVKAIAKTHHLALTLKTLGAGVGRIRTTEVRLPRSSEQAQVPEDAACWVLRPVVWISLQRQVASISCAISIEITVIAWRAVSRTQTPRCHLQGRPGSNSAHLSVCIPPPPCSPLAWCEEAHVPYPSHRWGRVTPDIPSQGSSDTAWKTHLSAKL